MLLFYKDLVMAISLVLLLLLNGFLSAASPVTSSSVPQLRVSENDGMKGNCDLMECKISDIKIYEDQVGLSGTLQSGTPVITVDIYNMCPCTIAQLHVNCGSFSSDLPVPPNKFRLVGDNDCLVNNGKAIASGEDVSFQYANTHQFPMLVSSFQCSGST